MGFPLIARRLHLGGELINALLVYSLCFQHFTYSFSAFDIKAIGDYSNHCRASDFAMETVNVRLQELSTNLTTLLSSNEGSLSLATAVPTYEEEFGPISVESDAGVPFEHLISSLKAIQISRDVSGSKFITLNNENSKPSPPTPLPDRISLLSNELKALIKFQPSFRISLDRFRSRFKEHFGRQFQIADYGYAQLMDLLEAMPDAVNVIGQGTQASNHTGSQNVVLR